MNKYEKPDFWSLKARSEGYPARSVYKLQEILQKFPHLIPRHSFCALDLGAAPGSWSLYLLRHYPARLVSCDLLPLAIQMPADDAGGSSTFIQGDFTDPAVQAQIRGHGAYSLILSDAAPATSGSKTLDSLRSLELAKTALFYAETCLEEGGGFAVKFFQGSESADFIAGARRSFSAVKIFKPQACRSNSVETYIIGTR
ncbi:MAG: RlmE family RNA methyltransferase [Spirochaetaceae bacterium]|nr:RlmE family RNA methyltransferase [Spirochaetaceae bacterium]